MSTQPKNETTKEDLLRSADFRYHFDRELYVNRKERKVVSIEAVEEKSEQWLRKVIADPNDSEDWKFYFRKAPSESVRQALAAELG